MTSPSTSARRTSLTRAVGEVVRSTHLRRLEAAYLTFAVSEYATWLAVLVYASARGGVRTMGLVTLAQVVPCVVLSPFAAYAGDRFPARRALIAGYSIQAAAMTTAAAAMWQERSALAYTSAVVAAVAVSFSRPVMRSLIPSVVHSPTELVSVNVLTGLVEQVGVFAGPALAGLLLAVGQPATVFVCCGVGLAAGTWMIARLPPSDEIDLRLVDAGDVARNALQGFVALRRVPILGVLVAAGMLGALVRGAADLLFVHLPEVRFGTADGYSGLLAAACGVGAIIGIAAAGHLVRLQRVRYPLIAGAAAVAAGFVVLAAVGSVAASAIVFAIVGLGAAVLELASSVAVQRSVDTAVLGRVFGVLEGLQMAALGAGTVAMSALVGRWSLTTALEVIGIGSLILGALAVGALHLVGDRMPTPDDRLVQRILGDHVLAPLPATIIERLALGCESIDVVDGTAVVRQGDIGDHYFLVVTGELDVTIDGRFIRTLGPGTSFGEIALLRSVPRTATVTARGAATLLAIARDPFLAAVTGHPRSIGTATQVAEGWLGA